MTTKFKFLAEEMDENFVMAIKKNYPGKEIEIEVNDEKNGIYSADQLKNNILKVVRNIQEKISKN